MFVWFRFSLLLLEFGEIYFEDFSAVYFSLENAGAPTDTVDRCVYNMLWFLCKICCIESQETERSHENMLSVINI